jgi:hypothetical protein
MLTRLKTIWKNKLQILEGLKNTWVRHPKIERIAYDRLSICEDCDLIDREGTKCVMPGTQPCCGECGCKLTLKARSLSSECPHPSGPKWKALMTDQEEDEYYARINYDPDKD